MLTNNHCHFLSTDLAKDEQYSCDADKSLGRIKEKEKQLDGMWKIQIFSK